MQTEVRKISQEEALKRIVTEYPEYTTQAMQDIKDGVDLVEILSLLDSYQASSLKMLYNHAALRLCSKTRH